MADTPEVKRIPLGSGKLYVAEYTASITDIPAMIKQLELPVNELGRVSGGASLEYKATFKTVEDDLQTVSRTILTADEATLKGGICTWNGNTLKKLCSTARVTEDTAKNIRIVKLGGAGNYDGKRWIILFVNDDKQFGKTYIGVVGTNQKGVTMAFAKDKETVIDPEFAAEACDDEGTKVIYAEAIDPTKPIALTPGV